MNILISRVDQSEGSCRLVPHEGLVDLLKLSPVSLNELLLVWCFRALSRFSNKLNKATYRQSSELGFPHRLDFWLGDLHHVMSW